MKCKKCGSENLEVMKNGPHYELFCTDCISFQKFVSKRDYKRIDYVLKKRKEKSCN
jgi:late competence protein required for DNA uptake (superfamily II DNA/RNA helicase)